MLISYTGYVLDKRRRFRGCNRCCLHSVLTCDRVFKGDSSYTLSLFVLDRQTAARTDFYVQISTMTNPCNHHESNMVTMAESLTFRLEVRS